MKTITKLIKKCLLASAIFTSVHAVSADYELTMQSSDQPGIFMYQMEEQFAKWMSDMTDGQVKITVAPVNSVVPYSEVLDSVGANILQGEFDDPSYFAGKDPAFGFIGNTVGAWSDPSEAIKFFYYDDGLKIFQKLYAQYDVHLVGVVFTGVESLVAKKPIHGVEDLKGLKIRAPEGMVQRVFAAAGAAPVNLPGSEVYTALEKGVIDASDYSLFSANQSQGMNDIARYPLYPGFHSLPVLAVTLNQETWDNLPKNIQAIMETGVRRLALDVMYRYQMEDAKAVKKAKAEGINIINWSPEERAKFKKIAISQWSDVTSQSPIAKEFADSLEKFLEEQGLLGN